MIEKMAFAVLHYRRHRGCIAFAVYSNSQATMDTASEPGVRGISFRAIPQSIKIINRFPS